MSEEDKTAKYEQALPAGHILNKDYCIEEVIGGGGFSLVYRAKRTKTDELVVIKEYLPDKGRRGDSSSASTSGATAYGIKCFFEEASALAKVSHPNIVQVVDFFRDNNTVYIVMSYEEGKDLRWHIKETGGAMDEKKIRFIFTELLLGLGELHRHKILHLDIKPANIFIRADDRPLLLDFGATRPTKTTVQLLRTPQTLTIGFAPIEQHEKRGMGPWTDIYAVGASIWACMRGKAPPSALKRAKEDKLPSAAEMFGRRYSPILLKSVDWCLSLRPEDRPQNVWALLDFLNQISEEDYIKRTKGYLARLGLKLPWGKSGRRKR